MIIVRSPMRISLGGGGTDLPSYYRRHGGFLIAGAIDKYVYITIHRTFVDDLIVKYSRMERVKHAHLLEHPIIREAMSMTGLDGPFLEITSMADIPAGTGLGSSGSFTTALLKALHTHNKALVSPHELAEQACEIELDRLREPIGKQDQYIASFGGITSLSFEPDGSVKVEPVLLSDETRHNLEDGLILFFTGYSRRAGEILRHQDEKSKDIDPTMIENLHRVKEIGFLSKKMLEEGNLNDFGLLMHEHWLYKRVRSSNISNPQIDQWYDLAKANGAVGGKLIGAGGGGFLLFYTEEKSRLRQAMTKAGLQEVRFRFDFEGTKVIVQ